MSPPSAIKVLHITPRISRLGGGVTEAIWGLVRATQTNGVAHTAVAVRDPWTQIDMQTAPAGCDVRTFEQKGPPSAFSVRYWVAICARPSTVTTSCMYTASAIGRDLPHAAVPWRKTARY